LMSIKLSIYPLIFVMKNLLLLIFFVFSNEAFAVNINTANAEELAHNLSGIGKNKAQRIIEYREKIGGFVSPEQLLEVKGISLKTLARNRNKIDISPIGTVDINTANAKELARHLSGVGKVKAQRIVEYREKIGGFVSLEQLLEVKDIGPKILARNRDKIDISPIGKQVSPSFHTPPRHLTTGADLAHHKISGDTRISIRGNAPLLDTTPQKDFPKVEKLPHSNPPISEGNDVTDRLNDPLLNTSSQSLVEDLSHKIKKLLTHNKFWDALIIIPLFGTILFIFVMAWFKGTKKDKPVLRKHLLSTTFVCSGCGKVGSFQNVRYKGHFNSQYIDDDLPPGWSCIPNWLGEPCDYCFDCSKD